MGCFCRSGEGVRGGWGRCEDKGGRSDPEAEADHRMQTWRQRGGDLKPPSGCRLAHSRSFFPREAKVGETVPTQSPVRSRPQRRGSVKARNSDAAAGGSAAPLPTLPGPLGRIGPWAGPRGDPLSWDFLPAPCAPGRGGQRRWGCPGSCVAPALQLPGLKYGPRETEGPQPHKSPLTPTTRRLAGRK